MKEEQTKKYKTYYMEKNSLELLDEYAKNTSLKKSTIVNMAIKKFFEEELFTKKVK